MNKAQKTVIVFFIVSIIAIAGLFIAYKMKNNGAEYPKENVLYYSETCPHCKNVEEFMKNNSISEKIDITLKEALVNSANKAEMKSVIEKCGIDLSKAGFPLLYTGADENSTCFMGDVPIINFLKSELNISG